MQEHEVELWTTKLFNHYLASPLDSFLTAIGHPAADPAHPWENWITMEILVVLIIMVLFGILRSRLSYDKPGKLQITLEAIYDFVNAQASEGIGHGSSKFVPFLGTLFIFILFMNLIGIIPGFESPTMTPAVPAGLAVSVFLYYNVMGFRSHGVGRYLLHFAGPVWWMAPIMIPIELISHLARPLSLTIRLYANMFAGEKVTMTFLALTYIAAPAIFMGLHVFVGFLQAFIFMLLTLIYVGSAVAHEH
ncbi:MAG: F-type H+-transporting ATPase subunit a [Bradyrhizobium sp.]|jgi:F-type H+-transporting ATPase subunit a|nr:F-type H+-transporting ATPase subunit a [Bradyrhizobium sp.]